MTDMLVKLYGLPDDSAPDGVVVRRAMAHEKDGVVDWVRDQFGDAARGWPGECEIAFARQPVSCRIAVRRGRVIGFACYDVTARGLLGPIGVDQGSRSCGVGRALLLAALRDMREIGYAYAIVGHVGSKAFFAKSAGAVEIVGSTPGLYPSDSAID